MSDLLILFCICYDFFFFNDTATTEIYTLSLHDALPILFSEGVLTFVDNNVDTTTGTVLLKGEFQNRDNVLWPGQFLNVRLQLYIDDKALVVPAQAVMTGQQGTYVFVLNQDGTARSQPVTVERPAGAYAVIAQGVRPGDEVVTDGQVRLVNGAAVEVKGSADPARAMEGDK